MTTITSMEIPTQGEPTNLTTTTMNTPQPPELNIDTQRSTTPMTTTRFTSTASTTTTTITTTINKPYGVKEIFKQFGSFSTRFTSTTTTTTTTITTTTINKYYGIKEIFKQFSVWQPSRLPTTTTATTTTQLPVPLYGELLFSASIMTCTFFVKILMVSAKINQSLML